MSISKRGQRSVVRWAAGVGVLAAFPFLASGVAQAAMAGGNPLTTTNRPDLRTVHVNAGAEHRGVLLRQGGREHLAAQHVDRPRQLFARGLPL